jgi:hypothetical protein
MHQLTTLYQSPSIVYSLYRWGIIGGLSPNQPGDPVPMHQTVNLPVYYAMANYGSQPSNLNSRQYFQLHSTAGTSLLVLTDNHLNLTKLPYMVNPQMLAGGMAQSQRLGLCRVNKFKKHYSL